MSMEENNTTVITQEAYSIYINNFISSLYDELTISINKNTHILKYHDLKIKKLLHEINPNMVRILPQMEVLIKLLEKMDKNTIELMRNLKRSQLKLLCEMKYSQLKVIKNITVKKAQSLLNIDLNIILQIKDPDVKNQMAQSEINVNILNYLTKLNSKLFGSLNKIYNITTFVQEQYRFIRLIRSFDLKYIEILRQLSPIEIFSIRTLSVGFINMIREMDKEKLNLLEGKNPILINLIRNLNLGQIVILQQIN